MDEKTRALDLNDARYAENTRAAYPIDYIPNASATGRAGHPKNVIMLTADAFGVLPPISRLTPGQAMYHFLSGLHRQGGRHGKGPGQGTAAHLLHLLRRTLHAASPVGIRQFAARADRRASGPIAGLVNTGWTGGAFGTGSRMPIKATRAL